MSLSQNSRLAESEAHLLSVGPDLCSLLSADKSGGLVRERAAGSAAEQLEDSRPSKVQPPGPCSIA